MKCKKLQEKENVNLQLKNKKKQKLKEKGITLIALVVTIIILLILAGVTLNMAMSGDGLFSRARNAADKYKKAQEDEENIINEISKLRRISTSQELLKFAEEVNNGKNFEGWTVTLMNDIDLSEVCGEGKGSWIPIGKNENNYFKGNFDGNNKTISNLWIKIDGTSAGEIYEYYGLFGAMMNSEVSNLTITGKIETGVKENSFLNDAGLCGVIRNSLIRKCGE